MERKFTRTQMFKRAFRPRVLVYGAILGGIVLAAGASLWLRVPLKVDVMRDRAAIAREVEGGDIENVYQLRIINAAERKRVFDIEAVGLPTIHLDGDTHVELPGADSRLVPLRARVHVGPGAVAPGAHRIEFLVHAHDDPAVFVREASVFIVR
jgi:polyferredoxin